jgi:hypothetical protein
MATTVSAASTTATAPARTCRGRGERD